MHIIEIQIKRIVVQRQHFLAKTMFIMQGIYPLMEAIAHLKGSKIDLFSDTRLRPMVPIKSIADDVEGFEHVRLLLYFKIVSNDHPGIKTIYLHLVIDILVLYVVN